MPNCSAKREPADPTNASVIRSDASLNRQVRRPYHCTVFGRRSVKIWCPQASVSQKNRRTRSSIRTGIPSQGRSLSRRQYRLWIRRDVCPHSGQTLPSTAGEEPSQARFVLPPMDILLNSATAFAAREGDIYCGPGRPGVSRLGHKKEALSINQNCDHYGLNSLLLNHYIYMMASNQC